MENPALKSREVRSAIRCSVTLADVLIRLLNRRFATSFWRVLLLSWVLAVVVKTSFQSGDAPGQYLLRAFHGTSVSFLFLLSLFLSGRIQRLKGQYGFLSLIEISPAGVRGWTISHLLSYSMEVVASILLLLPFGMLAITMGGVLLVQVLGVYFHLVLLAMFVVSWAIYFELDVKSPFLCAYLMVLLWVLSWMAWLSMRIAIAQLFVFNPTAEPNLTICTLSERGLDCSALVLGTLYPVWTIWIRSMSITSQEMMVDEVSPEAASIVSEAILIRETVSFAQRPNGRPGDRPMFWKHFELTCGGRETLIAKSQMYALGFGVLPLLFVFRLVFYTTNEPIFTPFFIAVQEFLLLSLCFALVIEWTIAAQQLFADEFAQNTWGSLAILPTGWKSFALQKLLAAAVGLAPVNVAAFFMLLVYWLTLGASNRGVNFANSLMIVLYFLVYVALVIYLVSLRASWTIFPAFLLTAAFLSVHASIDRGMVRFGQFDVTVSFLFPLFDIGLLVCLVRGIVNNVKTAIQSS